MSTRPDGRLKDVTIFSAISEQSGGILIIIAGFCRFQSRNTVMKALVNSGVFTILSDFISLEIQNTFW